MERMLPYMPTQTEMFSGMLAFYTVHEWMNGGLVADHNPL